MTWRRRPTPCRTGTPAQCGHLVVTQVACQGGRARDGECPGRRERERTGERGLRIRSHRRRAETRSRVMATISGSVSEAEPTRASRRRQPAASLHLATGNFHLGQADRAAIWREVALETWRPATCETPRGNRTTRPARTRGGGRGSPSPGARL